MSVKTHIVLHCNGDGCERVFRGSPNEKLGHVRLRAFGMDWNYQRGGKDFCPLHDPRRLVAAIAEATS